MTLYSPIVLASLLRLLTASQRVVYERRVSVLYEEDVEARCRVAVRILMGEFDEAA